MKLIIYAIAKNEIEHVTRWRETASEADLSIIIDTGSTDGTQDLADARISIRPFRFDDARNAALSLLPDCDACIALDMDETLEHGWRAVLEERWTGNVNHAWINYNFNGDWFLHNNRVHSRYGWRWQYPAHEALTRSIGSEVNSIYCPEIRMSHNPPQGELASNYLELLAWGQWENPHSIRMLHYYGRELMFQGYYQDAIERFNEYLQLEKYSPFPAERQLTVDYLGQCIRKVRAA